MTPTHEVTFLSTALGFCELSTETADNLWTVRFNQDGTQTCLRNLREVAEFPNTSATRALESKVTLLMDKIRDYQNARDTAAKRALYWEIRAALEPGPGRV